MDLMKELIHERKEPHNEDIASWRNKTQDVLKELDKAIGNVRIEDPDTDYYSKERAVKVTKELKDLANRMVEEMKKVHKLG